MIDNFKMCLELTEELEKHKKRINQYKQKLKRKEQECEEFRKANDEKNELLAKLGCPTIATARRKVFCLQEQLEAYKMEAEEGKEINAELKAENDELKKLLKVRIEDLCDSCGASSMIPIPCKVYEKTLTEIKEIAEHCSGKDFCSDCKYCEQCYVEDEKIPTYDVCKLILQKISECEANQ